jgi:hypothetical protein
MYSSLNPPSLPERRDSGVGAQPDDIEDVKKVCPQHVTCRIVRHCSRTDKELILNSYARWASLEVS